MIYIILCGLKQVLYLLYERVGPGSDVEGKRREERRLFLLKESCLVLKILGHALLFLCRDKHKTCFGGKDETEDD